MLGREDVGPLHQNLRGDAGGQIGQQALFVEFHIGDESVRQRRAEQHDQGILILRDLTPILGEVGPGRRYSGFGLMQIQRGADAAFEGQTNQPERLLLAVERVFSDAQQLLVRQPGQIGIGHFRYDADLRTAACFHVP